jgi:hypothetical protein
MIANWKLPGAGAMATLAWPCKHVPIQLICLRLHTTHAHDKRGHGTLPKLFITIIFLLTLTTTAFAGMSDAAGKVRDGIEQFKGGDFRTAAESFSAADDSLPNEPKIAFDRGCAYAAAGEYDKAVEQFQKAAAAPDHTSSGLAHYNLGSVAVARAKAKLGQKPDEAEGDARTASLELLVQATKHYRDCLEIDAGNSDARYNLETIRLWIKHIQDVWRERDRQKRRDSMDLLQFLQWLETEQQGLRQSSKELGEAKPSPRQREVVRAAETAQRALADEIQPLKEKIAAGLTAPQQQAGQNTATSPSADVQKAVELLNRLADDIRQSMSKAADSLTAQSIPEAVKAQSQAVEAIDQIFMAVAPYANLVQKGIGRQDELINQSPAAEKNDNTKDENTPAKPLALSRPNMPFDGNEAAWNERFVARYGRILSAKARRELEQLESTPAAQPQQSDPSTTPTNPNTNVTPAPGKDQQESDAQLKAEQQRRDMKEALQTGIQYAPQVEKLADEAASLLEENKPDEALPKQQEALKLLKEMLPKEQHKDQNQQDQDKKDQDKKDQQKQDQNKKDQDKKDQQKQDQQKKEQEKKNQDKIDQNKKDQQKKDQDKQQQQKQRDANKEQAEAVLNKARQRQDQYRELQKIIEGYLYKPDKVDKDW